MPCSDFRVHFLVGSDFNYGLLLQLMFGCLDYWIVFHGEYNFLWRGDTSLLSMSVFIFINET